MPPTDELPMTELRRILVVDDSKFYRALMAGLFEKEGYQIAVAPDGETAIQLARTEKPHCILLDVSLPGIEGIEVLVSLKRDPICCDVPVIMVTGSHNEDIIAKAFEAGAADYIAKPVSAPLARARVQMAIRTQEMVGQLKAANDQLLVAQGDAQRDNLAKSAFLASMSHEIRTPLTAILGFTDVLIEDDEIRQLATDRVNDLRTIKRNGEHLLELINDILDLSKIEAGKLDIERIPWSLPRLIGDVMSSMRVRAKTKGIRLLAEYLGPIPETIQVDPTRLRQILVNLVGNAIKFTDEGYVRLRIRLRASDPENALLVFDVTDTGIGMDAEQMERLFKPFSQACVSISRQFGGTGLGLTISRHLTEMMNGGISVKSDLGRGSTFSFTIPIGPLTETRLLDTPDEAHCSPEDEKARQPEVALSARILLAEDSPDNQRLVTFHLRRAGALVTIAENGRIAVDRVAVSLQSGSPFDLILMDIEMPEMDGLAATGQIRQGGYHGPIIALTAKAMTGDRERCLLAGCDDYVSKPIDKKRLLRQIAVHLSQSAPTSIAR